MLWRFAAARALATRNALTPSAQWMPRVHVQHGGHRLKFSIELPPGRKKHVRVFVEDGILTVYGDEFVRAWKLPENTHVEGVAGTLDEHGLTIRVPRGEGARLTPGLWVVPVHATTRRSLSPAIA